MMCKFLMTKSLSGDCSNPERAKTIFEYTKHILMFVFDNNDICIDNKYLKVFGNAISKLINNVCSDESYDVKYIAYSVLKIVWALLYPTSVESLEKLITLEFFMVFNPKRDEIVLKGKEHISEMIRTDFMVLEYKIDELYEYLPTE